MQEPEDFVFTYAKQVINTIMKGDCIVCRKRISKGDRMGFAPLHAGECTDKWNSYSEKKREELLSKAMEVEDEPTESM